CLYVVFCDRSCAHRDLHSFPTRRSSDLDAQLDGFVFEHFIVFGHNDLLQQDATPLSHVKAKPVIYTDLFYNRIIIERCRSLSEKDRKSTRLNSSHVKISYAVFCLKKKKK